MPLSPAVEQWMLAHKPLDFDRAVFSTEYGFSTLLDAIRELRRVHPLIGCVVMGDSERLSAGKKQATDAGLDEHLLFTGDVDHQTCLNIMARSSAFVRPTLEDGDSVSVREACESRHSGGCERCGNAPL